MGWLDFRVWVGFQVSRYFVVILLTHHFKVSLRIMLIGPPSAHGGVTIHHRKVKVLKLTFDLYARISEDQLATTHFNDMSFYDMFILTIR